MLSGSFFLVVFAFALPATSLVLVFRVALGLTVLVPIRFVPISESLVCSPGSEEAAHASCLVRGLVVLAVFLIAVGLVRLASFGFGLAYLCLAWSGLGSLILAWLGLSNQSGSLWNYFGMTLG